MQQANIKTHEQTNDSQNVICQSVICQSVIWFEDAENDNNPQNQSLNQNQTMQNQTMQNQTRQNQTRQDEPEQQKQFQCEDEWFLANKTKLTVNGRCNWFENVDQNIQNIEQAIFDDARIDPSDIEFLFESPANHNQEFLQPYYALRHNEFQKECGFKNYNGFENDFDRQAKILLAKYQGKIIAGCRIGFAAKGRFLSQEMPEQNYTYKSICQKANIEGVVLTDHNYVEVSGVVIAPNHKSDHLLELIFQYVDNFIKTNEIKYVFGVSDFKNQLEYKIALKNIGFRSVLLKNFIAPKKAEYNFAEIFPIIVFL